MKKIGIIIFIIALFIGVGLANVFSFGQTTAKFFSFNFNRGVSGSGNIVKENREIADFTAVDTGGVFQVEITAQKNYNVEIEADDNLLPLIKTETEGNFLKIETTEKINSKNPIIVRISAPNIEQLDVSGASKVNLVGLNNEFLNLDVSGASKVSIAGTTGKLIAEASGASKIEAENLKAENASVEANGASHIVLFASDQLTTDASGASKIVYAGTPQNVRNNVSGASSVKAK